ncbi:MAG: hypothetical protein ACOYYS_22550 [Chloroflexota bacterium]
MFPDQTPEWVNQRNTDARNLKDILAEAYKTLDHIEHTTAVMSQQPMFNAAPHWRGGKYLYLIFHQVNGQRERRYIGSDPENVREALAAVDRWKRWRQYTREFAEYERSCAQAARLIEQAVILFKSKPPGW